MEAKFICTATISSNGSSLSLLKPIVRMNSRDHITADLIKEWIEFSPGKVYAVIIREV